MQDHRPRLLSSLVSVVTGGTLTSLLWSFPLAAQAASSRPFAVIVSGGASVPVGGFSDYNDLGVHADVSLLIRIAGQAIRLRPEFTYGRFGLKENAVLAAASVMPASSSFTRNATNRATNRAMATDVIVERPDVSTLLGLLGNVEFPLSSGLYLIAGVGATSVKSGATAGASANSSEFSQTGLTYNGGAGLRFQVGRISGFVEGRLKNIAVEQGRALFSDVRTIPISFGLVF